MQNKSEITKSAKPFFFKNGHMLVPINHKPDLEDKKAMKNYKGHLLIPIPHKPELVK